MSGEPEIEEWVRENYDEDDFKGKTVEQVYAQINIRFENDNRSDLDHILRDERDKFIQFLKNHFRLDESDKTQTERVYKFMKRYRNTNWRPKQIALALGIPQPSTRRILQFLVRTEQIGRVGKGLYRF